MSHSLQPHGLQPARLLCLWDSPDKNTGLACHWSYLITERLRPPRQQPLGLGGCLGPEPDPPLVGVELLCQRDPQGSHHEVSIHLLVPRRPVLQTWAFSLAKKIKGECQSER